MNKVGIFVHSRSASALQLADEVARFLADRVDEVWQMSDWDDAQMLEQVPGTDLLGRSKSELAPHGFGRPACARAAVRPADLGVVGEPLRGVLELAKREWRCAGDILGAERSGA